MTAFLAGRPQDSNGRILMQDLGSTTQVFPPFSAPGGLATHPVQGIFCRIASVPASMPFIGGIAFSNDGAVYASTSTPASTDPRINGVAVSPSGQIYISDGGTGTATNGGVPVDANGSICVNLGEVSAEQKLYAIKSAGTGALEIFVVGDSISEGAWASDAFHQWIDLFAENLRTFVGYSSKQTSRYWTAYKVFTTAPNWAYSGTASTDSSSFGLGARYRLLANGSIATFTFTGTDVDVYMTQDYALAGGTYTIDGGAPTAFTSVITKHSIYSAPSISITGLSAGAHTLVITATGSFALEGARVYNGDKTNGIHVWDSSHAGYKTSDYAGYYGFNLNSDYCVPTNGVDLVLLIGGLNDYAGNRTKAQFKQNLRQTVSNIRQSNPKVPIVIVKEQHIVQFANPDDPDWTNWRLIYDQVATEYGCAVWDYEEAIGSFLNPGNPYDCGDQTHPNDAGHAAIANNFSTKLVNGLKSPYNPNNIPAQTYQDDAPNLLSASQDISAWTSINTPVVTAPGGTIDGSTIYAMQDDNSGAGEGKYLTLPTLTANRRYRLTIHVDFKTYTIVTTDATSILQLADSTFVHSIYSTTSVTSLAHVVTSGGTVATLGITDSYTGCRRVSPFNADFDIISLDFTVGTSDITGSKVVLWPTAFTATHRATMRFARPTLQLLPYGA